MRSTRGKTRAYRAQQRQTYTSAARVTTELHSTERERYAAYAPDILAGTRTDAGADRGSWWRNTNARTRDGGVSCYYNQREGFGQ